MEEVPPAEPPVSPSASSTGSKKSRKKRKLKLKRRKKKKYKQIIDSVPANEQTSLVIHATFKKPSQAKANLDKAKTILYASHFVAKFTELGWQFCLILFLTALTNYKSLALVSTYGLFTGIVVCLAGPSAGALVDSKDRQRIHIAQAFIWVQNISVIIATTCCFFLLRSVPAVGNGDGYGDGTTSAAHEKIHSNIFPDLAPSATLTTWILLAAVHIFGACGKLTDQSMTVAMERDWIVVMSKVAGGDDDVEDDESEDTEDNQIYAVGSQDSDLSSLSVGNATLGSYPELNDDIVRKLNENTWLTTTNTVMKQIDLTCRVGAPAAAGIFFALFDNHKAGNDIDDVINDDILQQSHWDHLSYAALIIGILNLISLVVEYHFIQKIYSLVPLLAIRFSNDDMEKKDENNAETSLGDDTYENDEKFGLSQRLSTIESGIIKLPSLQASKQRGDNDNNPCCIALPRSLRLYWKQPIFFGGFALSLLYLNVLTFGALMTAYLVWRGMSYETIGTLRGISSMIGLLGTIAYHISSRSYTLSFTGSWSIMFQFSCLTLCYASLYVSNDVLSLTMLIVGVIVSRVGLYVFDLTITQLMQQMIPEDIRGVIGGVQKSFNSFFDLSTYVLGLIFYDPSNFYILVATGFGSVGVAMCIFLLGIHYHKDAISKA